MLRSKTKAELKALYTIPEMADLIGQHRHMVARLLENNGVRFERSGRRRLVTLAAIREAMPDLFRSIVEKEALENQ